MISDREGASEETRLKYRYLDLRTDQMQKNMLIRHKTYQEVRKYLGLTIKTLKNYDENYGMKIGLILNRLFCRDISWTIYEYI